MALSYHFVLPPTGPADNAIVREMFDDVKAYVDNLIPSGSAAPINATYLTLTTNATLTAERVLTAGTGINFTDNGAGSTLVVTNSGVTSITGTANQVIASGATGAVTLSLPQSIGTGSSVHFARVQLDAGSAASPALWWDNSSNPIGFDVGVASNLRLTINATEICNFNGLASRFSGLVTATKFIAPQVLLDLGTSNAVTLTQNAAGAAYTLTFPTSAGTNGYSLTTDGSGGLSWTLRATAALSNLASTAVNASIIPASPATIDLGNTTLPWANVISQAVVITAASPSVWFTSFIASTGMAGNVAYILPPNGGSSNYVLTTNGSGTLSWADPTVTSGAANQALSNLAAVAINTTLKSDTNNTDDLGSSSIKWKDIYYAGNLVGVTAAFSGAVTISPTTNQLILGATRTVTLTAPTPASSSRTVTIPDLSADYSVVGTEAAQTINGSKTFSSQIVSSATSNHIKLATASNNAIITVASIATADRTITIPDPGAAASFVLTQATQTISGTKTFDGQLIGKGTATNDSASAGYIGEVISSVVPFASRITLTTATAANITSITLTAGDWDISGGCAHIFGANTNVTVFQLGISTTSNTLPGSSAYGAPNSSGEYRTEEEFSAGIVYSGNFAKGQVIPKYRVSLSGSVTFYIVVSSTFTVAGNQVSGFIQARRAR